MSETASDVPVTFMRLTGLPVDRFSALLAGAMPLIAAAERARLSRRERRRGTGAGKKHDKIYDQARVITAKGINRGGDPGYPGTLMKTPHKKPKGGTLTDPQKTGNRVIARDRIIVEHGTGGMQRFGIAAQRWRTPRHTRPIIMKNAAGLANWLAA